MNIVDITDGKCRETHRPGSRDARKPSVGYVGLPPSPQTATISIMEQMTNTRQCPVCDNHFEFDMHKQARKPIYCPTCKAAKLVTRKRYCPECGRAFQLTRNQSAGTTFCTTACSDTAAVRSRTQTNLRCMLQDCHERRFEYSGFVAFSQQPQFCSEAHWQAYVSQLSSSRLTCQAPECSNLALVTRLRRPQRFCSKACRSGTHLHKLTSLPPNSRALGIFTPVAAKVESRGNFIAKLHSRDGWTQEAWDTFPGPVSPAAVIHLTDIPDPALKHITLARW